MTIPCICVLSVVHPSLSALFSSTARHAQAQAGRSPRHHRRLDHRAEAVLGLHRRLPADVPARPTTCARCSSAGAARRAGGFSAGMDNDCLRFKPTIATTCFGMNDGGYAPLTPERCEKYRDGDERRRRGVREGRRARRRRLAGLVDSDTTFGKDRASRPTMYNKTLAAERDIAEAGRQEQRPSPSPTSTTPMIDVMDKAKAKYGDELSRRRRRRRASRGATGIWSWRTRFSRPSAATATSARSPSIWPRAKRRDRRPTSRVVRRSGRVIDREHALSVLLLRSIRRSPASSTIRATSAASSSSFRSTRTSTAIDLVVTDARGDRNGEGHLGRVEQGVLRRRAGQGHQPRGRVPRQSVRRAVPQGR